MLFPVHIDVGTGVANVDPVSTPNSPAIAGLLLQIPKSDKNLAAPTQKVVLVSTVNMTVDVYAADDATISTGSDASATAAQLSARKFYIAQTAVSLVANTLKVLDVPWTGFIYLRVTTAPGSDAIVRAGTL